MYVGCEPNNFQHINTKKQIDWQSNDVSYAKLKCFMIFDKHISTKQIPIQRSIIVVSYVNLVVLLVLH